MFADLRAQILQGSWVTSHVVEQKGADEWATKVAAQDIFLSGLKDFVRRRIESAMEADDVERARVEANRRAREEAGAARQRRTRGFEDLPVP